MARKKDENITSVQTFITKDASDFLKKVAKDDYRSVSKYVQKLIMQHLESKGYVASEYTEKKTINNEINLIEKVEQSANNNFSVENNGSAITVTTVTNAPTTSIGGKRTRSKNNKVAPMNL